MFKKALLLVYIFTAGSTRFAYSSALQGHSANSLFQLQEVPESALKLKSAEAFGAPDTSLSYKDLPWQSTFQRQNVNLPFALVLLRVQKDVLTEVANQKAEAGLRLAPRLEALNRQCEVHRNELKELSESNLLDQKITEDSILKVKTLSDSILATRYGSLFDDIDHLYKDISMDSKKQLWLASIYESTILLNVSKHINNFKRDLAKQPTTNKQAFFDANVQRFRATLDSAYAPFDLDADRRILRKMMSEAATFGPNQHVSAIYKIISRQNGTNESLDRFINDTFAFTKLKDQRYVLNTLLKSPLSLSSYNDGLLVFEKDLGRQVLEQQHLDMQRKALLEQYLADYSSLRAAFH